MFLQASNSGEVYQAMEALYMQLFHSFVYTVVLGMVFIVYYYRRDLRDTLAYLAFSLLTIYSGIWDVLYYWFQMKPVPETLPHLADAPPGTLAYTLRSEVTREMLYLNSLVFMALAFVVAGSIRYGWLSEYVEKLEKTLPV